MTKLYDRAVNERWTVHIPFFPAVSGEPNGVIRVEISNYLDISALEDQFDRRKRTIPRHPNDKCLVPMVPPKRNDFVGFEMDE